MAHLPINESQHGHAAALLASSHLAGPEACSEHIDVELFVPVQPSEQVYSVPVGISDVSYPRCDPVSILSGSRMLRCRAGGNLAISPCVLYPAVLYR